MGFSVEIRGIDHVLSKLDYGALCRNPMQEALTKSALAVEADAKRDTPRDKGELQASVTHVVEERQAQIGTNLNYAPYVHGYMDETKPRSEPHWPPFGPGTQLAAWASRHGIPAFLVARSISKKGTPLVPFLKTALEKNESRIQRYFQEAADAVTRRWGEG